MIRRKPSVIYNACALFFDDGWRVEEYVWCRGSIFMVSITCLTYTIYDLLYLAYMTSVSYDFYSICLI